MGPNTSGYPVIQRNQMIYRPVYAVLFGAMMLSAPFGIKPLRKLLGNRVTRFLSGISMNYYLLHPLIIVHMRRLGFPPSLSENPNQAMEQPWQTQYTLLAFALSFLAAAAVTYLVEKPVQRWMDRQKKILP
jgi:peptidoglycan/LPS O-acetylase OafA/YrhL